MPRGVYKHQPLSEDHKKKIGLKSKGNKHRFGKPAWNKGLTKSDHRVAKYSEGMSARMKGRTAWNKGKKLPPHTEEWKQKVRATKRANPIPENKHASWKGNNAGIAAMHRWVEKWKGKQNICEMCGKICLGKNQIHWANIDHTYKRVLEDYIRLCQPCHGKYDSEKGQRNHNSLSNV